ncbi:hybrid sensor histidine kinase/response regulator transcription factor [Carboxylicivirga marina]|uniref:histidine kinase n=1 Tax=Carboxylicivirga marina TaxID=2800988 RepID=A0ABS1HKN4_9BACT|nr:response regulator [Carboxylicivirga marina]MBK3518232.1 response regulator [Carboxylicivirga marina]
MHNNKLFIPTVILLLLFTSFPDLIGQEKLKFKQLSVEEGIKNSRVVDLTQDGDGFMWFATHDGVDKFNGTDFKHYSLSYPADHTIKDDIVNCLELSPVYHILCGTKNGNLFGYNKKRDKFEKLLPNAKHEKIYNINSILSVNRKEIWIGATSGFFHYNITTQELTPITGISSRVNSISSISDKSLLIGTLSGLYQINTTTKAIENIHIRSQLLSQLNQQDIMVTYKSDKHLLLGTRNSEAYKFKIDSDSIRFITKETLVDSDNRRPIYDIKLSPDKQSYTIAIDGYGLVFTDLDLKQTNTYFADNTEGSLTTNGLYQVHYSSDNILWLATYGGGIIMSDPNKKKFKVAKKVPFNSNSIRNNIVNAVLEYKNSIWFGTKDGISIYYPSTDKWKHLPPLSRSVKRPFQVMSMCLGEDGSIWVATYGRGLIKINPQTFQREQIYKASKGWKRTQTNHLYQVIKDAEGRIWSGGIWGGVTIIDESRQRVDKIDITNVRSLHEENELIYIGTLFGLFIIDKQTLKITRPTNNTLLSSRIISMCKHPSKELLYVGTDVHGLHIWDLETDSLAPVKSSNSLPTNFVRSIIFDNQEQLWVSSTGGLSLYNDSNMRYDTYNIRDGLPNTEFSENAAIKHSSGQLIFGGSRGVSWFYPKDITKSKQVVKPILTSFEMFGQTVQISNDGPLNEHINLQEKIHLAHNQNSLSFRFGSICYTNPQNVSYKWKLEGFEDNWNGPSNTREAIYSKLPPGNFIFKVMVSNDDGVWQDEVKTLTLKIDKPFWKTPLAYVLYGIILIILILLNMHYYHTIVQDRHYAEKQQFFISIAHDLRTPLSLIKLPIEKMLEKMNSNELEGYNIKLVKRNVDRLTNMVNQLLDFQKADLKKMQLQVELTQFEHFIRERIDTFSPLSTEKNISIDMSFKDDGCELWLDRIKVEKIMFNLLSNAFKYTDVDGSIKIRTKTDNKYAIIEVEDTGEGIPSNQQKKIFQRYYRASNAINSREVGSGVGLMLTKQLVELHGGLIDFVSVEKVGSIFTIKLPLGDAHFSEEHIRQEETEKSELIPIVATQAPTVLEETEGPKLLIVEDHPELLESLQAELAGQYQVYTAADGAEGLSVAMKELPDIVISDVMMPKMNGHQLCTRLKNEISTCHIPIILLTALDSPEYKREGLEYGADAYLEKPFDIQLVKTQIKNLLKNRQLLKGKFLEPSTQVEDVSPTNTDQVFLNDIKDLIINNIDSEKLTVEFIASELGMSRPVLYRKIKSLTDLSPQQFLMTVKLKEAIRIMKEEGHNISETAYRVGFTDPKYFSQTFKKYFKVTPSQYLKDN